MSDAAKLRQELLAVRGLSGKVTRPKEKTIKNENPDEVELDDIDNSMIIKKILGGRRGGDANSMLKRCIAVSHEMDDENRLKVLMLAKKITPNTNEWARTFKELGAKAKEQGQLKQFNDFLDEVIDCTECMSKYPRGASWSNIVRSLNFQDGLDPVLITGNTSMFSMLYKKGLYMVCQFDVVFAAIDIRAGFARDAVMTYFGLEGYQIKNKFASMDAIHKHTKYVEMRLTGEAPASIMKADTTYQQVLVSGFFGADCLIEAYDYRMVRNTEDVRLPGLRERILTHMLNIDHVFSEVCGNNNEYLGQNFIKHLKRGFQFSSRDKFYILHLKQISALRKLLRLAKKGILGNDAGGNAIRENTFKAEIKYQKQDFNKMNLGEKGVNKVYTKTRLTDEEAKKLEERLNQ